MDDQYDDVHSDEGSEMGEDVQRDEGNDVAEEDVEEEDDEFAGYAAMVDEDEGEADANDGANDEDDEASVHSDDDEFAPQTSFREARRCAEDTSSSFLSVHTPLAAVAVADARVTDSTEALQRLQHDEEHLRTIAAALQKSRTTLSSGMHGRRQIVSNICLHKYTCSPRDDVDGTRTSTFDARRHCVLSGGPLYATFRPFKHLYVPCSVCKFLMPSNDLDFVLPSSFAGKLFVYCLKCGLECCPQHVGIDETNVDDGVSSTPHNQ